MGRDKKNEKRTSQFTKWLPSETRLPAWKALSSSAQAAYMHFCIRCWSEGKNSDTYNNNGRVALSARTLAKEMGVVERTAQSAMADLQAKGWIVCTKTHALGFEGRALAPEWRLTMRPALIDGKRKTATREPTFWKKDRDFAVVEYATSKKPGHAPGDPNRFVARADKNNVVKLIG